MEILIIVVICLTILYLLITYFMFVLISRKLSENILPMKKIVEETVKPYSDIVKKAASWVDSKYKNNEIIDVYVKSDDNLKLHASLIENKNAIGTIIEVHGYRSDARSDLFPSVSEYYNMGYNILLIDQRASNQSEGKYITFGIKESKDIIKWVDFINDRYKNKRIILAGISMGASTILMSAKYITDDMNIKAILVDSGYISPYREVLYCIKHYFHMDGILFIDAINLWCKLFAKYKLNENDTVSSLSNCNIPILFAHGLIDDFVPAKNTMINYEKYKGPKRMEIFDEATHGIGFLTETTRYLNCVKEFLSNID